MNTFHRNTFISSLKNRRLLFLPLSFLSAVLLFSFQRCTNRIDSPRILVFDKAEGYYHESTKAGIEAFRKLCRDSNMTMDITGDGESFTADNLKKYTAVVFLNTAGDVLNQMQEEAFKQYIHAGGGFMGVHTAIDTEHNWEWYGKLTGAHFKSQSEIKKVILKVEDKNHPASRFIHDSILRRDEWFELKNISPDINIILSIDENSYDKETIGDFHPVSWYHEFEGGRVFVTTMGHTSASYQEEFFIRHLAGGLKYTIGENKPVSAKNTYADPGTTITHTDDGFVKTSVLCDLNEPMEMDIFPDGKIIFIERGGSIKLYDPAANSTKVIGNIAVFTKQEEGLLGIAIDPGWNNNHWVYVYYTPKKDNASIRLSRFVCIDNSLDLSSEKVLLNVPTQKGADYYHAAGSIEFDANGFLYLSTGDNSSPRGNEYAVIDESRGRIAFDAQKSSSNSMDLRGKILRIKPLPDGSYLCPEGNLFVNQDIVLPPASDQNTDDPRFLKKIKGTLNPAALKTTDETASVSNHPSKAGHQSISSTDPVYSSYGRPEIFVMGVRNPFRISYDDKRQTLFWGDIGPDAGMFDSLRGPEGYDEINAAHTAGNYGWPYFIGPNLAYRDFDFETKKPGAYFDPTQPVNNSPNNTGSVVLPPARPSLIWYSFRSSKEFPTVANGTRCAMAGPVYYGDQYPTASRLPDRYDKNLFIYDWMRNWIMAVTLDSNGNYIRMEPFAKNLRLNRPVDMQIDKKGAIWILEYGTEWYTGNKDACLSRIDFIKGDSSLFAGANKPAVQWDFFKNNRSFYQAGNIIPYKLKFADAETEQLVSLNIDIQYKETNQSIYEFKRTYLRDLKKQKKSLPGQLLVDKSDCKSCHALNRTVNGPSYIAISSRYYQNKKADSLLKQKIINGGSGNWGERAMIAHPQLSQQDVNEMVNWILSLGKQPQKIISPEGRYRFTITAPPVNKEGVFIFHSSINNDTGETIMFRSTLQQVEKADSSSKPLQKYQRMTDGEMAIITEMKNLDFFVIKQIDLHGIKSVEFAMEISAIRKQTGGGLLELHLNSREGPLLGSITIPVADTGIKKIILPVQSGAWPKNNSLHDLFFVVKNENNRFKPVVGIDRISFNLE